MSENTNSFLTSRFEEALVFAHGLHQSQVRKGSNTPYVTHLLTVSAIVLENGGDEDTAIAALLHDAIEDQGGAETGRLIETRFGARVLKIVEGCTDTDEDPKPPWRERKERYLAHLATETDPAIVLVSMADKLHNARSTLNDLRAIGDVVWERFRGGKDGNLWYYGTLLETYKAFPEDLRPQKLLEEFRRVVTALEEEAQSNG